MLSESARPVREDERLAMLAALVDGDVSLACEFAVALLGEGLPFDDLVADVIAPVQAEVGRRWAVGDLSVADEHSASAVVEALLVRVGVVAEASDGPAVVVASAQDDAHALGARVVATALALEGYRVLFLGASVPAGDLGDSLAHRRPIALALSCSMPSTLVGAARSVAAAHDLGIPVVGGGRALGTSARAERLGIDALVQRPGDAIAVLRAWEHSPREHLGAATTPVPEHRHFVERSGALVTAALTATQANTAEPFPRAELHRVLPAIEGCLLLADPGVLDEHVQWLYATGPAHGFDSSDIDAALSALAAAMDEELGRAGHALRDAIA